jgi:hypothetical protein
MKKKKISNKIKETYFHILLGVQPWAPSKSRPSVAEPRTAGKLHVLTAASSVSMAMERYVVHLPPAIVTRPLSLTCTMWFLTSDWESGLFGSETNGRMPLQAESTSPRRTSMSGLKYDRISPRMNSISASVGLGWWVTSHGVSVVPAIVKPWRKKKKMVLVQLDFKDTGSFAQRRPNAVQIKFLHNF